MSSNGAIKFCRPTKPISIAWRIAAIFYIAAAVFSTQASARAHPRFFARRPVHFLSSVTPSFVARQSVLSLRRTRSVNFRAPRYEQGVIAEALRYLGAGNVTGARGAWCADYASMVLRRTGHRPLANRMASSALAYGPRVSQPRAGDLVVLNSRGGYAQHVGFFAGWDHGRVILVSGNWGHRVARASVFSGAVAAFIRV